MGDLTPFPRRPGGGDRKKADPGAPRASNLLLAMLAIALIGLAFATALTLVSVAD